MCLGTLFLRACTLLTLTHHLKMHASMTPILTHTLMAEEFHSPVYVWVRPIFNSECMRGGQMAWTKNVAEHEISKAQ